MSFSFNAVGTADEVVDQLGLVGDGTHGTGDLGPELAQLLAKHLAADVPMRPHGDHEHRYVVEAAGHSGGSSPTSLTVTLKPHYVRMPAPQPGEG